jgi:hypothetical protein
MRTGVMSRLAGAREKSLHDGNKFPFFQFHALKGTTLMNLFAWLTNPPTDGPRARQIA